MRTSNIVHHANYFHIQIYILNPIQNSEEGLHEKVYHLHKEQKAKAIKGVGVYFSQFCRDLTVPRFDSPEPPNQSLICVLCSILDGDLTSLPWLDGLERPHEHFVQPQCVSPVRVHDIVRVDHVPSRLAHLFPIGTEDHSLCYRRTRFFRSGFGVTESTKA